MPSGPDPVARITLGLVTPPAEVLPGRPETGLRVLGIPTLDAAFNPRSNALNALRLVLAACVIVSHAWVVGGYGAPPTLGGTDLGMFAVCGFFALSGYLVAGSCLGAGAAASAAPAPALLPFLWRRFLRIYPAFLVVLLVTALVFAPVSLLLSEPGATLSWPSAANYVFANSGLHITQWGSDGTLGAARLPVWNVPLWTLVFEALCYLAVGVLASVLPRRLFAPAAMLLLGALTVATLLLTSSASATFAVNLVSLGSFFVAGVVLFVLRQRMPLAASLALVAAALVVLTLALGVFTPLGALPVAYVLMYLGARLPVRVGSRTDISYGLYVYGFAVQQLLVLCAIALGVAGLPVAVFAAVSVAATVPFALASWFLVERPALRLKRMLPR